MASKRTQKNLLNWSKFVESETDARHVKEEEQRRELAKRVRVSHVGSRKVIPTIQCKDSMRFECDMYHLVKNINSPDTDTMNLAVIEFILRIAFALKYYGGKIDTSHWAWLCLLANLIKVSWDEITPYSRSLFSETDKEDLEMCSTSYRSCHRRSDMKDNARKTRVTEFTEHLDDRKRHIDNRYQAVSERLEYDSRRRRYF